MTHHWSSPPQKHTTHVAIKKPSAPETHFCFPDACLTHIAPGIPSLRSGPGRALSQEGWAEPDGFLRAAVAGTHSAGGSSFLGSGKLKDGGGFLPQSKNPRCSELRKSFRISQRIAPLPRLLACQALEAAPPEPSVPATAALRNPPGCDRPATGTRPVLARSADAALTAPSVSHPSPPHTPQSVSMPETVTGHLPL